jgi:hypothetical protein
MRFLTFIFILFSFIAFNQVGTGQWRLHVPAKKAIDVTAGNNIIYTAFENGLLEYSLEDNEKRLWTAVNGLSDITLTSAYYDNSTSSVYIGYDNGNFDKLTGSQVINIPAIKLAQIQGSKRINKIVRYGNFIYLATGFAVVKIDPIKNEVKDTYYPTGGNDAVLDVAFRGDSIYALSSSRLYSGNLNNIALTDPAQWITDSRLPIELVNQYKDIENVNDELFVLFQTPTFGGDSIFRINSTNLELVSLQPFSMEIMSLTKHANKLAANMDGGVLVYNSDFSLATVANSYSFGGYPAANNSVLYDGFIWIADNSKGLTRYLNEFSTISIPFDGPPKKEFYSMDWFDNRLVVSGGGLSSISPTFSGSGVYIFEDEKWTLRDRDNMNLWNGQNVWDFVSVSINPKNKEQIAVSTFSEIPVSIMGASGQVTDTFTPTNSTLKFTALGGSWSYVSSVNYDENEDLWALNAYSDKPLNVLTKEGNWYSFDCGTAAKNKFTRKMVIDYNGHKWFAIEGAGIFGYNHNETIETASDDKYKNLNTGESTGALPSNTVTALAVDFDNEIWIGTDNGFAVLYNSESAFDASAGNFNAQRIKVEFEGNVEYVLGNTSITDIVVDGGNRKWIATANSGLVLLSSDGLEIIEQHTMDNSPLISNNIIDLQLDNATGELFIITDQGLISYRTDATYEDPEYSNVTVFPNPARPEFEGPITIQGIRYDSDIKITDVAGNLVYQTTSNGGTATWNGKTITGEPVVTGVYLIWTAAKEGKGRKVGKVLVVN